MPYKDHLFGTVIKVVGILLLKEFISAQNWNEMYVCMYVSALANAE